MSALFNNYLQGKDKLVIYSSVLMLVVYFISLILPVYGNFVDEKVFEVVKGYEVLMSGWAGWMIVEFRWYANLLYYYVTVCSLLSFRIRFPYVCCVLLLISGVSVIICRYPFPFYSTDSVFLYGAYLWALCMIFSGGIGCLQIVKLKRIK